MVLDGDDGRRPTRRGAGIVASADVGSTSVHLAVARVDGHTLESLHDVSAFLRLGDRLQASPVLGAAVRAELLDVLRDWRAAAQEHGADGLTVVGTEPLRRAADAPRLIHEAAEAGIPVHVLDHDEEGILTLLGATGGMPVAHDVVLVDIGGGSTELVVVGPGHRPLVTGVRIGAAQLSQRHVTHDPPTDDEMTAMLGAARTMLAEAPGARPTEIIAVGGTASNLRKLVTGDPIDARLHVDEIRIAVGVFTKLPAEALTKEYLVNPVRSRILPAGAAIMLALLERYGRDAVRVSEQGIREGAVFAVARAGPSWRDQLRALAQGWGG